MKQTNNQEQIVSMCKIIQHQSRYITRGETQGISWSTLINKFSAPMWKNLSLQTLEHSTVLWKKAWWLLLSRKKEEKIKEVHLHCMHIYWSMYADVYKHLCTYTHTHTHKPGTQTHMHTNTDLYKPFVNSVVSEACFTLVVHKHARGLKKEEANEIRDQMFTLVFIQKTQKSATAYPAYNHIAVALMQTLLLLMT